MILRLFSMLAWVIWFDRSWLSTEMSSFRLSIVARFLLLDNRPVTTLQNMLGPFLFYFTCHWQAVGLQGSRFLMGICVLKQIFFCVGRWRRGHCKRYWTCVCCYHYWWNDIPKTQDGIYVLWKKMNIVDGTFGWVEGREGHEMFSHSCLTPPVVDSLFRHIKHFHFSLILSPIILQFLFSLCLYRVIWLCLYV